MGASSFSRGLGSLADQVLSRTRVARAVSAANSIHRRLADAASLWMGLLQPHKRGRSRSLLQAFGASVVRTVSRRVGPHGKETPRRWKNGISCLFRKTNQNRYFGKSVLISENRPKTLAKPSRRREDGAIARWPTKAASPVGAGFSSSVPAGGFNRLPSPAARFRWVKTPPHSFRGTHAGFLKPDRSSVVAP